MSLRKSHAKSRFGCLPCKKRHIKCGEETPSCQNCVHRRVACAYGSLRPHDDGQSSKATSLDNTSAVYSQQTPGPQIPSTCFCGGNSANQLPTGNTRLQELQLMIHYTTATYETMSNFPDDVDVWRKSIPEEAVQHEFLMDGLLALSSLHFACENPHSRWQYTEIAIQYQNSGLEKYKIALEKITDDNRHALFAFSIIINVLALAFPNVSLDLAYTHIGSILTMLELLQGIRFITHSDDLAFREGKFAPLFRQVPQHLELTASTPSDDAPSALFKLRERADHVAGTIDPERHQAYISGIEALEVIFGSVKTSRNLGLVLAWPTMISEQLLGLFKSDDPMTQLIFIYYGVLLLHARDRWWGRNTGTDLIESLAESLCVTDPEWAVWTKWAKEAAARAVRGSHEI